MSAVDVREIDGAAPLRAACALLDTIWGSGTREPVVPFHLLRALSLTGGYIAGAYSGDDLLGVSVGFFGPPGERLLHSHVTGVAAGARGLGIGRALKLHQRRWAIARGVRRVRWTFDPLVRRNAHVNLARLGASVAAYLPDVYGPLDDEINAGDVSDRLLVEWDLESEQVARAIEGRSGPPDVPDTSAAAIALVVGADGGPEARDVAGPLVLVEVPADVEAMRRAEPALAARWRTAVREALGGPLGAGARVTGFGAGGYVVRLDEPCG